MAAVHVGHADDVSVGVDGDVAPEEFAVRRIDGQRLHLAQAVADDAAARVFFYTKTIQIQINPGLFWELGFHNWKKS